ncbi:ABC transporter permease subunit, partial [Xanthomonas citri pv. citri]
ALALSFIVLPVVVRTTDEMLRLVPSQMREAALSLGIPQWKVTVQVLYRSASAGIVTGILLALARISGETAPLLFTACQKQEQVQVQEGLYTSVEACTEATADPSACRNAFAAAQQQSADAAPKYASKEACAKEYPAEQCQ